MKSVIISKAPINWDKVLLINALAFDFDEKGKQEYIAELKEMKPWLTEDELEIACAVEAIGRNVHILAMETIIGSYTAEYHESDIQDSVEVLKRDMGILNTEGHQLDYNEAELREKAKGYILHELVYEDLAKMWNITVSESHLFFFLKVVYGRKLGLDASKYLNDPKEFERARRKIIASEVGKRLRRSFRIRVTVPKYRKFEVHAVRSLEYEDPDPTRIRRKVYS